MTENELLSPIYQAIVDGETEDAVEACRAALDAGIAPITVLNDGLMKGAEIVGNLFEKGEYFLPELMMTGRALKASMEVVKPALIASYGAKGGGTQSKVVIATVQTDIHDIGKNLVASMLTASGFEVTDMGVDVPLKAIIDKAEELGAEVIGLSALLTTSMPFMKDLIDLLKARGLRDKYKIIVGGASVTPAWAQKIGADGTAANAAEAVHLVRRLLQPV